MTRPLDLAALADRLAVEEVLYRFADGLDRRDWAQYRAVFTDEIDLDYSSYRPTSIGTSGRLTTGWRAAALFPGLDATQHTITNPIVELDGDRASHPPYVRADHVYVGAPGGDIYTLGGYYDDGLVRTDGGWRIHRKSLHMRWQEGNRPLMQLALERAQARAAGESI
ncbi:MAG: nuclear transport factor 2 family protein [Ilumatobacteraceae bacterium]